MTRWALRCCCLLLIALLGASRAGGAPTERWSVVEMAGKRIGSLVTREEEGADGAITTSVRMEIRLARGETPLGMSIESEFVETKDGAPVRMSATQRFGGAPVTTRYAFEEGKVVVTTEQNGQTSSSAAPAPEGAWTTPAATRRFVEAQLKAGAKAFTVTTVDPVVGLMSVKADYAVEGPANVEAFGKTVAAIKWRVTPSFPAGSSSVEYVDERGESVRSELALGALKLTVLASEKEVAQSSLEPAEMMASTLAPSDKPIELARELRRGVYTLSVTDEPGAALPDLPTTGAQRVERIDARTARVTVDLDALAAAPEADLADASLLEPSTNINCSDPAIIALTKRALASQESALSAPATDAAKAETLRRFVRSVVTRKNLAVGLATASDVARTLEGDCSEHAVLLAAVLRAAGIPSRVASGMVYMDEFLGQERVFGYHMWTQALVEVGGAKRWVDVDAALSDEHAFDATHVALSVSSMKDGEVFNSMAALAPVMGRVAIRVE